MKAFFLIIFGVSVVCFGQRSTNPFADDMKRLVELNTRENTYDLSSKEAVNIYENANVSQIIEITVSYINSKVLNERELSLRLLQHAFSRKAKALSERQILLEIILENYLEDRKSHLTDNFLPSLAEKDFNSSAKTIIKKLMYSKSISSYAYNAKWLSYAQINESVPTLWGYVKKDSKHFDKEEVAILASSARLVGKEAGISLCDNYNSQKNRTDYKYIFLAKQMVFSLDQTVLKCLVDDYKTMDISLRLDQVNEDCIVFFTPAQVLEGAITEMIKNYPYKKGEYNINPKQLLDWLNQTKQYELNDK